MEEIDDATHAQIEELCSTGDAFVEEDNYEDALKVYWEAFDLIPEPKKDWHAATWVLTAIGDTNYIGSDFVAGIDNLSKAMECPEAIGNPFIHLRLGQCYLETDNPVQAAAELTRAYAVEGKKIFADEDPKYLEFLATKIKL